MRIWSISDIGLVRHENQDACQTMLIGEYTAAVVCDGMGGTAGGAVASHLAVQTYREHLEANLRSRMTMEQLKEVSGFAIAAANEAIRRRGQEDASIRRMGTTLVAAVIRGEDVLISNVGDSRAYLLSESGIRQISKDHSLVESMVENVLLFIVALHGIVDVGDTPHLTVHFAGAPSAVRIDFINRDGLLHRSRDFVAAPRSACGGIFI